MRSSWLTGRVPRAAFTVSTRARQWENARYTRVMKRLTTVVFLATILALTGCAADSGPGQLESAAPADAPQVDDAPAAPTQASALSGALDCDAIAGMIAPLADAMHPTDFNYVKEDEIGCVWVSTPGASAFEGSALDLMLFIWQNELYANPDVLTENCAKRSAQSELDNLGGCIYEDVAGDGTTDAVMPYFKIRMSFSCEGSTTCTPTLPPNSDQLVADAMSAVGTALARG